MVDLEVEGDAVEAYGSWTNGEEEGVEEAESGMYHWPGYERGRRKSQTQYPVADVQRRALSRAIG